MSKVFYSRKITPEAVVKLLESTGISNIVRKNDLCAIKTHFGEKGNRGYIKKELIRPVVDKVLALEASPFLTDTNTMYPGMRGNSADHIRLAEEHGFSLASVGCPVIISDGLKGKSKVEVQINKKHFKKISVAGDIFSADSIIVMTHVKGHGLPAIGGALKNIGMGCAARSGKYEMHNTIVPIVNLKNCKTCGICVRWCPSGALTLSSNSAAVNFNKELCVGCGECLHACKNGVFRIPWNESMEKFQEKLVEYVYGILKNSRYFCINVLNHITRNCDCMPTTEKPLIDEVGIIACTDPVAVDWASIELINKKFGSDFFRHIFPHVDYTVQFKYAEELELGSRKYELIEI